MIIAPYIFYNHPINHLLSLIHYHHSIHHLSSPQYLPMPHHPSCIIIAPSPSWFHCRHPLSTITPSCIIAPTSTIASLSITYHHLIDHHPSPHHLSLLHCCHHCLSPSFPIAPSSINIPSSNIAHSSNLHDIKPSLHHFHYYYHYYCHH
jgi:hypothetical protein